MYAPYERSRKTGYSTEPKSGGFVILTAIVAFVLVVLLAAYPKAPIWISQTVQAEFGGGGLAEDMPAQQPGNTTSMRTVHAQ